MGITLKNNKSVTKNMTIKGDNGVGIKTITSGTPVITEEKTTTPITVTLTDETTQNFNVEAKNGSGADNALTKPSTAPSATQIVAVDNTNTQTMLNLGDGLSVENGNLKASNKLYTHNIRLETSDDYRKLFASLSIISKSAEIFTIETLKTFLTSGAVIGSGVMKLTSEDNIIYFISQIGYLNNVLLKQFFFNGLKVTLTDGKFNIDIINKGEPINITTVTDKVVEI